MKNYIGMGVVSLFLLSACHSHEDHNHSHEHDAHGHEIVAHDHEHDAHDKHNAASGIITLTPEKAKVAGVEVIEAVPQSFRQVLKVSGQIQAAQGTETTVVAKVAGIVRLTGLCTPGMALHKGQELMHIVADEMPQGDPVARARVVYETAKDEFDRANRLIKSQIISQKEYNAIKEKFETARLAYEAVAKNQTKNGVSVKSPLQGYIKSVFVEEGNFVSVGQPLYTVSQNNKLFLRADVSERYYHSLKHIVTANFKTPYDNKVYELDSLNGRLVSSAKMAGSGTYYLPVTFCFDNKIEVVSGSYVEVYLQSDVMPNTMVLPVESLTEEQGLYFVYLQQCPETYKKQEVKLGACNGKDIQILSGVQPGDKVVVKGAYHVKLASASAALPAHSHSH